MCGHFPDGCQLVGTHQRRETAPKRRVLDHERVDLIAQGREKSACGIVEARPETFGRTALPIDVLGTGGDDHFAERRDLDSGAQSRLFVALPSAASVSIHTSRSRRKGDFSRVMFRASRVSSARRLNAFSRAVRTTRRK